MQLSRGSKEDAGGTLLGRMTFEGDSVGHSVVFDASNVSIPFQSVLDSSKLIPAHSVVFDALNVSILFQSVLDSSKLIPVIMEVRSIGRRSVAW